MAGSFSSSTCTHLPVASERSTRQAESVIPEGIWLPVKRKTPLGPGHACLVSWPVQKLYEAISMMLKANALRDKNCIACIV